MPPSTTATTTALAGATDDSLNHTSTSPMRLRFPSVHSDFSTANWTDDEAFGSDMYGGDLEGVAEDDDEQDASRSLDSGGAYNPPAWRRLGGGDNSAGFWQTQQDAPRLRIRPLHPASLVRHDMSPGMESDVLGSSNSISSDIMDTSDLLRDLADDQEDVDGMRYDDGGNGYGHDSECDANAHADTFDQDDDEILAQACRTRLPTGSLSPEKERSPDLQYYQPVYGAHVRETHQEEKDAQFVMPPCPDPRHPNKQHQPNHALQVAAVEKRRSLSYRPSESRVQIRRMNEDEGDDDDLGASRLDEHHGESHTPAREMEVSESYIRFAVRAQVQQRTTAPVEAAVSVVRRTISPSATPWSWSSAITSLFLLLLALTLTRSLVQPAAPPWPVPDLIKVAGIARAFEPLIYYSESGAHQVGELQATGVAVWDLGESVRTSNMTSAPVIVKELDDLAESLKTLAIELTKFFANVDGDIDGILIVMDWARRELIHLESLPSTPFATAAAAAFDNMHNLLTHAGLLEDTHTHAPTRLGALTTAVFGLSRPQRTQQTLERAFTEFLSVLEDAVSRELHHTLALFALFEAIDHQFLNLGRSVAREAEHQDAARADALSGLWTRLLGPRAADVAKFERNRRLLRDLRARTVRDKTLLVEHNRRLLALKANLEALRRRLVSPLVRSVNSSAVSLEAQVRGLEDVRGYLSEVRAKQKDKLMEVLYGSAATRGGVMTSGAGAAVEELGGGENSSRDDDGDAGVGEWMK